MLCFGPSKRDYVAFASRIFKGFKEKYVKTVKSVQILQGKQCQVWGFGRARKKSIFFQLTLGQIKD